MKGSFLCYTSHYFYNCVIIGGGQLLQIIVRLRIQAHNLLGISATVKLRWLEKGSPQKPDSLLPTGSRSLQTSNCIGNFCLTLKSFKATEDAESKCIYHTPGCRNRPLYERHH